MRSNEMSQQHRDDLTEIDEEDELDSLQRAEGHADHEHAEEQEDDGSRGRPVLVVATTAAIIPATTPMVRIPNCSTN
jgi:hypothetical protein